VSSLLSEKLRISGYTRLFLFNLPHKKSRGLPCTDYHENHNYVTEPRADL